MADGSGSRSSEARQRWRVVFARDVAALAHADAVARWEAALLRAGVPVTMSQGKTPRPRLAFAAPLPVGMLAEGELVDLVLWCRLTVAELRGRLEGRLPDGYRLVGLHDVWMGEPTVAARLAAADYRVVVRSASASELAEACSRLLGASSLNRARPKGEGRSVAYDLRPLVLGLSVVPGGPSSAAGEVPSVMGVGPSAAAAGEVPSVMHVGPSAAAAGEGVETAIVRMRLRHAPDGGTGRPEEVVLALGEALSRDLELGQIVRERLLTADELTGA